MSLYWIAQLARALQGTTNCGRDL